MKIHVILMAILVLAVLGLPCAADDSQESFNSADALYSSSVDLANAGKYQEALDASDKALAMNVTSMTGLIQSNRAGILVMLHRDDEAITAADAALAVEENLTTVHSIAWYNKGNALRALGKIAEAQNAYTHAYALDNTLVPPDMSADIPVSTTSKSPLSPTQTLPLSQSTKSSLSPTQALSLSDTLNSTPSPTPNSPLPAFLVLVALGLFSGTVSIFRKK